MEIKKKDINARNKLVEANLKFLPILLKIIGLSYSDTRR